jgi:hypothetical protein
MEIIILRCTSLSGLIWPALILSTELFEGDNLEKWEAFCRCEMMLETSHEWRLESSALNLMSAEQRWFER